jgi:molybdopterin converting factor small subunit
MHVEFLGIARERTGVTEVELEADSLGEALDLLVWRFPSFAVLMDDGGLHPSVVANLNADVFIHHRDTPLTRADRLLILSSDAGG